jgi:undecaprenyl-diphosphatase
MITFFQSILIGLLQGFTELFPISSLGHSVIYTWLFGWNNITSSQSQHHSFFLYYLVALHVATSIALIIFYRKIWYKVAKGFFGSVAKRKIDNPDARLAWLLIFATVPIGIIGIVFEGTLREQFAKPLSAIIFIILNGFLLLATEEYIRKKKLKSENYSFSQTTYRVSEKLNLPRAFVIGVAQIGALFAGISRSGITMMSGLVSGLSHEDAARFSFLLATPVILGAGILKLPQFFSDQAAAGMHGQIYAGAIAAGISAYISVKFLDKYFQTKTLRPFGIYCVAFGATMLIIGSFKGF